MCVTTTPAWSAFALRIGPSKEFELGVHQDDVLAGSERLENDAGSRSDRPRHFYDDIDGVAGGQHRRIVSQHRHPAVDHAFRLAGGTPRDAIP